MPSPSPLPPPSRLSVLYGGEDLVVRTLAGEEITVRVALVPLRRLGDFIDLFDKPSDLAEFVCHVGGKPAEPGWADQLPDAVVYAIHDRAKELNFQRAKDWISRQSDAVTAAKPFYSRMLAPVQAMLMEMFPDLSRLPLTSPGKPASTASRSSTNRSPGSSPFDGEPAKQQPAGSSSN